MQSKERAPSLTSEERKLDAALGVEGRMEPEKILERR